MIVRLAGTLIEINKESGRLVRESFLAPPDRGSEMGISLQQWHGPWERAGDLAPAM